MQSAAKGLLITLAFNLCFEVHFKKQACSAAALEHKRRNRHRFSLQFKSNLSRGFLVKLRLMIPPGTCSWCVERTARAHVGIGGSILACWCVIKPRASTPAAPPPQL